LGRAITGKFSFETAIKPMLPNKPRGIRHVNESMPKEYSSIPGAKPSIQMIRPKNRGMEYCKVETM